MVRGRIMHDLDVTVKDNGGQPHRFVNCILPDKRTNPLIKLGTVFPLQIDHGIKLRLRHILHLYDLYLWKHNLLQIPEFLLAQTRKDLVRIRRINIFHRGLGKGVITGLGEILMPGKIIDLIRITGGDLLRTIR